MSPNFDDKETAIRHILGQMTPDQIGVAKTLATLKIENKTLRRQNEILQADYGRIYAVMLTILDACDEKELRVHESQFQRFKEEYRIDQRFDEETKEVVLKLLTLKD